MAVETPVVDQTALVGRQGEVELLDHLLGEARAGRSNTFVLRGEPGIGKTTLLEYAIAQASDGRVLQCRGVEWESELPFSGLIELVRPLVGSIDELPDPQRAALAGVLALAPAVPMERFAVYVATLSLLALASRSAPLLVVVDDAHWLDSSSAEALAFVARRLQAEGILMLVALRDDEPSPFTANAFHELVVRGLSPDSAEELLLRDHPGLEPLALRAVLDASGGNPLALRELPAFLTLTKVASEVEPLPTGPVIEDAFLRRVRQLPPETQRALVVASAGASDPPHTIFSAMARFDLAESALGPAEEVGLIRVGTDRLVFDHPLVRSAVYSAASHKTRRVAHAALANASAPEALDQRAWHRAAATSTADEAVATELEQAAVRARERNGRGSAALAFERAARLTPDPERCSRRLYQAAVEAAAMGRSDHALALLSETVDLTADATLRADAQHLRGRLLVSRGAEGSGDLLLREGLRVADHDRVRGTVMVAESIGAYLWAFDLRRAGEVAEEVERVARPGNSLADLYVEIAVGFAQAHGGKATGARALALSAGTRLEQDAELWTEARACVYVGILLCTVEEYERARSLLSRMVADARATSALLTLAYGLTALGVVETRSGRWLAASTELEEAAELTGLAGSAGDHAWALVTLARLEAARGNGDACRAHAARALAIADSLGLASHVFQSRSALGLLELGAGRPEEAIPHLLAGVQLLEERGSGDADCQPYLTPDLVEAYVRAGAISQATSTLERYENQVDKTGVASARAAALRCRGLLAGADELDDVFGRALAAHEQAPGPNPFERARTRYCFGERLRRAKRRGEAEGELEAALGTFERLGAKSWADHARSELDLAGRRSREPRSDSFESALTPQELRVALVVATGATNREVAAQLFLSVKTIENHLSRVFEKLQIRSRAELARIIALEQAGAAQE
jgi:DNA-binding CsgD family transcriptional regulator